MTKFGNRAVPAPKLYRQRHVAAGEKFGLDIDCHGPKACLATRSAHARRNCLNAAASRRMPGTATAGRLRLTHIGRVPQQTSS